MNNQAPAFWVIEGDREHDETWRLVCPFPTREAAERYAADRNRATMLPSHFVEPGTVDPAFHPGFGQEVTA